VDAEVPGIYRQSRCQGGRSKKLIEGGDGEANFAYYALLKLHILPSVFLNMDEQEKAFVIAAIKIKIENDKKKERELKSKIH
jgi:hypothetical protein